MDFALHFKALLTDDYDPFPWQTRLYERLCMGNLPETLDIPTGLGKTSVMALWLLARAKNPALPRRLVYVVDRRAVVDQATEEAVKLRDGLDEHPDSDALKKALGICEGTSLPISTLRGQYIDNCDWLADPATSAIVVGTVDMIGSRLLFSGYGVSPGMRPNHAGLLGQDSLIVLDEAHLIPTFGAMLRQAATDHTLRLKDDLPPMRVMALSATQRSTGNVFTLEDDDRDHCVVRQRIEATKRLTIEQVDAKGLADRMADEAIALIEAESKPRIVIFCNARKEAEAVHAKLSKEDFAKQGKKAREDAQTLSPLELLVGARRVHERGLVDIWLKRYRYKDYSKKEKDDVDITADGPAVLIATSAGEVGVDLDAQHAVMDLVPWERMVQRLGRVNRRGEGDALVTVLDTGEKDWLGGGGPAAVRALLGALPDKGDAKQAGPQALSKTALANREWVEAGSTPEPLRPALTRAVVDAWSLTGLKDHTGRPDVGPWLRGWIEEDRPRCTAIWRTYLPPAFTPQAEVERYFSYASPHLTEQLETEVFRVFDLLQKRATALAAANGKQDTPVLGASETAAILLAPDRSVRAVASLADLAMFKRPAKDQSQAEKRRKDTFEKAMSGATVVIAASLGGITNGLLDPAADGAPQAADGERWRLVPWTVERHHDFGIDDGKPAQTEQREVFRLPLSEEDDVKDFLIVRRNPEVAPDASALAVSRGSQFLDEHTDWVTEAVRAVAKRLDLTQHAAELLTLAAQLHDEGKRSKVWQNFAMNTDLENPLAKSLRFRDAKTLNHYRHEFGSMLIAKEDERVLALAAEDRDLVLHLIAAHHGHARPTIRVDGCESGPPSMLEGHAREAALRFARLQQRLGPWGLAWWESLLRAADRAASVRFDMVGGKDG